MNDWDQYVLDTAFFYYWGGCVDYLWIESHRIEGNKFSFKSIFDEENSHIGSTIQPNYTNE